ncbi:MAG: hypothetical protein U0795_02710 [Pirellulales bacterium]
MVLGERILEISGASNTRDLSLLPQLKRLKKLVALHSEVNDIRPLAKCRNLEYLVLSDHVTDVSALAGRKKLRYLNLSVNEIRDPTPLAELSGLTKFVGPTTESGQLEALRKVLPNCQIEG